MTQPKLKCKRNGCRKQYIQSQNTQISCGYHPGKPIFHDTKKGWTCCNKIVYDWDQFQKLPTCAKSTHTNIKQQQANQFYKSNTVLNAQNALDKQVSKNKIIIQDINKYNAQIQAKKKKQQQSKIPTQKKLFKSNSGKLKCVNQGCGKKYLDQQNHQDSCQFHKGQPVFHDVKKYWNCCGKQTLDWDQFMKLPKCCTGYHSPKFV